MAKRGELTPAIIEKMTAFFGRVVTVDELRLLPHITHIMMNCQRVNHDHLNDADREVLKKWHDAEHVDAGRGALGITGITVSKEFWDFATSIVFDAYVIHKEL